MSLKTLSCETIGELSNGIAGEVINAELKKAVIDLQDRGDDGKPRIVLIQVEMLKKDGADWIGVQAHAKLPPRRSHGTQAVARCRSDQHIDLLFQNLNAERVDQPTFPTMDADGGEIPNE